MPSATAREFQLAARRLGFSKKRQAMSGGTTPMAAPSPFPSTQAAKLALLCFSKFCANWESRRKSSNNFARLRVAPTRRSLRCLWRWEEIPTVNHTTIDRGCQLCCSGAL